jgi:hypothetical protein
MHRYIYCYQSVQTKIFGNYFSCWLTSQLFCKFLTILIAVLAIAPRREGSGAVVDHERKKFERAGCVVKTKCKKKNNVFVRS